MAQGCVIFDFDGVIAPTEELHLAAYNAALAVLAPRLGRRLELTPTAYFSRYVVFGDAEAFERILRDAGLDPAEPLVADLCRCKNARMERDLGRLRSPPAGLRELLEHLHRRRVRMAICSSARGQEIATTLDHFQLRDYFQTTVAIEDVQRGKPDPEGYALAFQRLADSEMNVARELSLAIEDTAGGATAAHGAGLRVLGVAATESLQAVRRWADHAVSDLSMVDFAELDRWLGHGGEVKRQQ